MTCFRRTTLVLLAAMALSFGPGPSGAQKPQPDAKADQHVDWEGWSFDWSVRPREALVITDVSYRGRKVLKYAGLAELFTIYDQGQPRPLDFAQGYQLIGLTPGVDCSSGEWCKVFDAPVRNKGKGHVMLHEERTGPNYLGGFGRTPGKTLMLWTGIRFTGGSDGYTFIIRWKFRDDGTLIPEVGATGVPQHLSTGDTSPFGAFIGTRGASKEKVFAPGHVHNFLYRLDFDVDGEDNTVEEFNWELDEDAKRGAGTAPTARCTWTPLVKETGRPLNAETYRSWRVVNRNSKNALGHQRSYQLLPGSPGIFRSDARYADEASAQADLWVTRHKPGELGGMAALAKYANDEEVENTNVVLWHWLGFHHFPRSEDWVHQPAVWCSFQIMPRDFLDASPLKAVK